MMEPPTPTAKVEKPKTPCIKGELAGGTLMPLTWLEPLELWDKANPPMPSVEVEVLRIPCVKEGCPAMLEVGPAPPNLGLCE